MESRKITIISTKNQRKSVIMSSAETLGELKADLLDAGVDYADMVFYEGTSKTSLAKDDSILPKDVPFKGEVTNELVFMLTNPEKKIKSGSNEARLALYDQIRKLGIAEIIKTKYGKGFTTIKSEMLIAEIEAASPKEISKKDTKKAPKKAILKSVSSTTETSKTLEVTTNEETAVQSETVKPCLGEKAITVLRTLIDILVDNGTVYDNEVEVLYDMLDDKMEPEDTTNGQSTKLKSSYSDDDIDSMFADI